MPADGASRIEQLLPDDILMKIKDKIAASECMQSLWRLQVSPELAKHTRIADYQQGVLRVQADSPAWAAKLRHQGTAIVRQLRQQPGFEDIQKLQLRVVPADFSGNTSAGGQPLTLSDSSRQLIQLVAQEIQDPKLKQAMLKLSHATDQKLESKEPK